MQPLCLQLDATIFCHMQLQGNFGWNLVVYATIVQLQPLYNIEWMVSTINLRIIVDCTHQ